MATSERFGAKIRSIISSLVRVNVARTTRSLPEVYLSKQERYDWSN